MGHSVTKTQSAGLISCPEHRTTSVLYCTVVTRAAVLMFPLLLQSVISSQMRLRRLRGDNNHSSVVLSFGDICLRRTFTHWTDTATTDYRHTRPAPYFPEEEKVQPTCQKVDPLDEIENNVLQSGQFQPTLITSHLHPTQKYHGPLPSK